MHLIKTNGTLFNGLKEPLSDPYPNVPGNMYDASKGMDYATQSPYVTYITKSSSITYSKIMELINMHHPIYTGAGYYNQDGTRTGGHATVIKGYDSVGMMIEYVDPLGDGSIHLCYYNDFCNGNYNDRIWDGTIYSAS